MCGLPGLARGMVMADPGRHDRWYEARRPPTRSRSLSSSGSVSEPRRRLRAPSSWSRVNGTAARWPRLGLPATIFVLHGGRTLAGSAERLVRTGRRVVILTDWDTEGGHLAHRLAVFLEAERLDLDLETRRRLARILRGELVHVEGLYSWARRLAEKGGDSLEALLGPVEPADEPTG